MQAQINTLAELQFLSEWLELLCKNEVARVYAELVSRRRDLGKCLDRMVVKLHLNRIFLII